MCVNILVLMSTYNGEKYITEQLKSIFKQNNVKVDVILRDDGSTDNTVLLVKKLFPEVKIIQGANLGYRKSFMHLLLESGSYDYYAFADQDDVWMPQKLAVATSKLKSISDIPAFYCSNLQVVDEKLNFLSMLHGNKEKITMTEGKALIENISYGCTLVFNKKLKNIAVAKIPDYISHDGWINLIGLFFGIGIYDNESYIYYRQHGNNLIGGNRSFIAVWKKRLKSISRLGEHHRDVEATEFLETFGYLMSDQQRKKVEKVAFYRNSLFNKFRLFFDRDIRMSTLDRDFWYRMRIIFSSI